MCPNCACAECKEANLLDRVERYASKADWRGAYPSDEMVEGYEAALRVDMEASDDS